MGRPAGKNLQILALHRLASLHSVAGSKVAVEHELPNLLFTSISTSEPLVPCNF